LDREIPPLRFSDLDARTPAQISRVGEYAQLFEEYRPWRKVRAIARDLGLAPDDAWAKVKTSRLFGWRLLELLQANGSPFGVCIGPSLAQPLHHIDRATGGGGPAALSPERGDLGDAAVRARLSIKTLMDEAAESSLIEGAATTRKEAVDLLRSGRAPKSIGERMVVNNYVAMQQIKRWLGQPLSIDMLIELQSILTLDTLQDPGEAGRLRRADETVRVEDARTGDTVYIPPAAADLPTRLKSLCDFANASHDKGPDFLHPMVKACILHFMLGYEHPFCDGNGRTARAIFYWFALRSGYTIFEYTAISELIRKGYARYPQAYIDTELDEGDVTYFVVYKLDIIQQSLRRLAEHLDHEQARIERSRAFLRVSKDLNLRQRLLLEHAIRHPMTQYTVKSHMNSNGVVAATARIDLDDLVRRRLMVVAKHGKQVIYQGSPSLASRLERRSAR